MRKLKLGISISLSGRYSLQGRESFEGLALWASHVNQRGGLRINDSDSLRHVELVSMDDESSAEICRSNTEKLISTEKTDLLLGPYSSSLALAAAEVAEAHGRTMWNHGGATDEIGERGFTSVVSSITPTGSYMKPVIDLVRETDPDASRIALFYARDSGFSRTVARGAKAHGKKNGFEIGEFVYSSGEREFSSLLTETAEYGPDLLLAMGRPEDDLALAGRILGLAIRPRAAALIVSSIKLFKDTFGRNAEGFLSASQWESGLRIMPDTGPAPAEFRESFFAAYGKEPDYLAAQGYNIGLVIERCVGEAGTLDDKALLDAAHRLSFNTFYGAFRIDSRGVQTGHSMLAVQWQNGRKRIVYPPDLSESEFIYPM